MKSIQYLILASLLWSAAAAGRGIYLEPDRFVSEAFGGTPPSPAVLWLTGEVRDGYQRVTGEVPRTLRVRYWQRDGRSAWILEAIGKEQPITAGFVVENGRLQQVRVLEFRESRGWEVRFPFFTDQFDGAALGTDHRLDRSIDAISGATLSVRAMRRMARAALFLSAQVGQAP